MTPDAFKAWTQGMPETQFASDRRYVRGLVRAAKRRGASFIDVNTDVVERLLDRAVLEDSAEGPGGAVKAVNSVTITADGKDLENDERRLLGSTGRTGCPSRTTSSPPRAVPRQKDPADDTDETAAGLVIASDGIVAANKGLIKALAASKMVQDEREDLRETVHRLETMVMEQGVKIQQLLNRG